jgi:transcriptional regulator GlxA family with amidase domain
MLSRVDTPTNQATPSPGVIALASGGFSELLVPSRGGLRPRAFRRVRQYILAHLAENISNRVLAELVGLSAFHFARAFRQSAGVSPHRFMLQSRVERVKHLLVETELSLSQIAIHTGFADQSHCTRRFRELVGITPSRFRWLTR